MIKSLFRQKPEVSLRDSTVGFTLIEIVIGLAVMSMTILAATLSYVSLSRLQQKTVTIQNVQQNGRYVLEAVSRDIRNAAAISEVNPHEVVMASSLDAGTIIHYRFDENDQVLYRRVCPVATVCDESREAPISSDTIRITEVHFEKKEPSQPGYVFIYIRFEQASEGLMENDPYFQRYDLNTIISLRG